MIVLKKGKTAVIITACTLAVLLIGGTTAFYFVSNGTFDPVTVTSLFSTATEPPTETVTKATKPTEPPTEKEPELETKLSSNRIDIANSETAELKASLKKGVKNRNYKIRYSTSDENIAQVDDKGIITPLSKGKCKINVYIPEYEKSMKSFDIEVEDSRINELKLLNEYLFNIKTRQTYSYSKNRTGTAKLTGCKIEDIDNDGSLELLIKYNITDKFQKIEYVKVYGDSVVSYQTEKTYSDITGSEYSSYIEDFYIDTNNNWIYIISESVTNGTKAIEKNTQLYSISGVELTKSSNCYSKEPYDFKNMKKESLYKVNDKKKTRDEYTIEYTAMKSAKEKYENYVSITSSLSEGSYIKAEMPFDIGKAYYDRIVWSSSDEEIAKVSDTGMITCSGKSGSCVITGVIDGLDFTFCKHTVNVSDVSDEYENYVNSIKDKEIVGKSGNKMRLYAYTVIDIDLDGTSDLLLYYTGGNGCQIEFAHYAGNTVSRKVIRSVTTENGSSCYFEFYTDSTDSSTVMYASTVKTEGSKIITDFHYESYKDGQFETKSSDYTIITDKSKKSEYKIGGETVDEKKFNSVLARYRKLNDWILVS